MRAERIAVIDLGTNTFHLLIAEIQNGKTLPVYSEKKSVRIGQGGINQGFITEEACERALNTMHHFKKTVDHYETSRVYATATSAFRNATNGSILAERILKETEIKITIISGDNEAELIYDGVKEAIDLGDSMSLIIDIGGGSVEFVIANKTAVFWKQSFEVGGQRLMEFFHTSDPISTNEIKELRTYLSEQLSSLKKAIARFPVHTLVGSAGSFETLSEIDLQKKGIDDSIETKKEYELQLADFHNIYHDLISKEKQERLKIPGMIELRVDMIVVAAVLIHYILEEFSIKRLLVSTYSLKEGVLNRILKGKSITD